MPPLISYALMYWTGWHTRSQTLPTIQPEGKASQYLQNEASVRRAAKNLDTRYFLFTVYPRIEWRLSGQFAITGWARRGIHSKHVKWGGTGTEKACLC